MVSSLSMAFDQTPPEIRRARIVAWVATSIIPHEPAVRAWLRPRVRSADDVDDLVQEAYAKLAAIASVDRIMRPRSYFFQTVQNLLTDHIRRERIVRIEAAVEVNEFDAPDDGPDPERIVAGRREFARIAGLIDELPDRCRDIFRMRKIEGLSQREIATRLGVSESVVENDGARGLRLLMRALGGAETDGGTLRRSSR